MTMDMYQENILDHYQNPRNKGKLEQPALHAQERNPLCGDEIEIFATLGPEERIAEVKFGGLGCAISQAAMSMLSETLVGKSLAEIEAITTDDIKELVMVPLSPVRLKCAILSIQTVHKSIGAFKLRKLTSAVDGKPPAATPAHVPDAGPKGS